MSLRKLTRGEVAKALGVSRTRVRQLEGNILHPQKDESGIHRFDAAEVRRVAASRSTVVATKRSLPGVLVALVFRRFREGAVIADIVIETELDIETVEHLYERYRTPLGTPTRVELDARAKKEADELEELQREWERSLRARRSGRK